MEVLVMPRPGLELRVDGVSEATVRTETRIPVRRFTGTDLAEDATVSVRMELQQRAPGRAWLWLLVSLAFGAAALLSVRLSPGRR
jgi:hypothetical protein